MADRITLIITKIDDEGRTDIECFPDPDSTWNLLEYIEALGRAAELAVEEAERWS